MSWRYNTFTETYQQTNTWFDDSSYITQESFDSLDSLSDDENDTTQPNFTHFDFYLIKLYFTTRSTAPAA